jgi:signal transduction histidine kinase
MGLFVQDGSGGIFVYLTGGAVNIKPGQYVEISGFANEGRYSSIVDNPRVIPEATGPVVTPLPVSLGEIYQGGLDAQWVEVRGVVRSQKQIGGGTRLELAVPPHRITVWIPQSDHNPPALESKQVSLRGVVGTLNFGQKLVAFQLFVSSLDNILVEKSPRPTTSTTPIGQLTNPALRLDNIGRVRVRGVVSLCWPGRELVIQDTTGAVEIQSQDDFASLSAGTSVEVVGYLGPVLEAPRIEDAVIQRGTSKEAITAVSASVQELVEARHQLKLVQTEGTLVDWASSGSNKMILVLQANGRLFNALFDETGRSEVSTGLLPGCRVRLRGVPRLSAGPPGADPRLFLMLRSPEDLQIIAGAPTAYSAGFVAATAAALLLTLGLLASLWRSFRQRRETEHVLRLQATLQAEMHQGEQQLRRSMEERDRIGRDLHDDIIQSIYAVGLNLEDCRRVVRESPQNAEARLATAINTLNNAIRSVRGFLAGLEPKVLNGREFKTALKSLALTSGEGPTPFHLEVDPSSANSLTSVQATQLLHIAKEGMSNSLRHAHASNVSVLLHPVAAGIRLEVRDNGAGFDPDIIGGLGHGLRNMTSRAREIGADFQIVSAPGHGCSILVTVPQRNPNERD